MRTGTRALLVTFAVSMVGLLMLRASWGAAESSSATVAAVDPGPSTLARPVLESYTAFGYRQGSRQTIELVTVGDSAVELTTASAFFAMRDAAALAGISLMIESGFRTHAEQKVLWTAWRRGQGNRAARPGESNHQSGRALDISVKDPDTFAWLSANASQFGFTRTVASEPWHWEYVNTPRARTSWKKPSAKKSASKKSASKKSSGRASRSRSRSVER